MAAGDGFNPYRVLGLERGATAAQVARAYRAAAKQSHPDLHGPAAERRMQELNRAFHLLSDPELRADWDAGHPASGQPAHWDHHRRAADAPAARTDPASWASWEIDHGAPAYETVRVRAAGTWPRGARQPAPAATGLRDSAWPAVAVAAVLLVALLFLGWVASAQRDPATARQAIGSLGLTASTVLPLDPDHELAVIRDPSGLLILVGAERRVDGGFWEARILAQFATAHPISVIVYQNEDAPGDAFSSVAFGRADGEAARVRLPGVDGRGGDVNNGTWAVAIPGPVDADTLAWEFLRADGSVIARGSGELILP